jgi:hypothetical protein
MVVVKPDVIIQKWDLNNLTFRLELFKEICLTHCSNCEKKVDK